MFTIFVNLFYKLHRGVITYFSTMRNKLLMTLYGIQYGSEFYSCGNVLYRNYAGKDGISIGENVSINSSTEANPVSGAGKTVLFTSKDGHIRIGNNVGLSNCVIFSFRSITIGNDTCIGAGSKIYDTDFHSIITEDRLKGNRNVPTAPVMIGDRVFVGANVTILKGVTIGEGAVIGAGSIVTHNVPSNEVWAGNPAKFIKRINVDGQ